MTLRIDVLHDPECIDPVEKAIAKHYGVPHDAAACACRCHEFAYSPLGVDALKADRAKRGRD